MTVTLLVSAVVILSCVFCNKLSVRLGLPTLLVFIVLGMVFGSDGLLKIPFEDYRFAEEICSVALIFIMFYGGFGTNWKEAKPVATKSLLLSTLGVVLTAGLVGVFCYFILKIALLESLLIGAVISSTDAASVFSILRSKKLGLRYNTASMLEVESGSNDPCSYMLTAIMLSVMEGNAAVGNVLYMIFAQMVYGAAIGVSLAFGALFVLKRFKFPVEGFDAAFVLAVAVLSYALPSLIGGNGYLSAYIVGIILGNAKIKNKPSLVHFFDGITSLMQMLIFFLLGLLSTPTKLPLVLFPSLAIGLFLTFMARPLSVFAILSPMRCRVNQQLLVSFSGLRGAASIVFAIMVTVSGAHTENDVFHIVFGIVLMSIAIQGTLLPLVSRKLNMIDQNANVLRTFNDYIGDVAVQFVKLAIAKRHPWKNKKIKDLHLPGDALLVLVIRGESTIVPGGDTLLQEGDVAVLSAPAFQDENAISLIEVEVGCGSKWKDKKIWEYSPAENELVIMIKRGRRIIIPRGNTTIREGDILVINSPKKVKKLEAANV